MRLFKTKKELVPFLDTCKEKTQSIALVPTMGALHEGHLSLVKEAYLQADIVVISIFINPTQFNNSSDLAQYPRTLAEDVSLITENFPDCVIYSPAVEDIYNHNITAEHFDFGPIANEMEGKYRAGHFDGVGTVLKRLFAIVAPDKAFFGEKDFQQLQIVKKLVELTGQPVEIIGCPISREANGLARSSRNKRLSEKERNQATFIYEVLREVQKDFGTKSVHALTQWVTQAFEKNTFLELEYFQISDEGTLKPIEQIEENKTYRAFIAAYANDVRLIDNIALT